MPNPSDRRRPARVLLAGVLAAGLPGPASAQEPAAPPRQIEVELGDILAQFDALPPPQRVGARALALRESQIVADSVLLVDSPEAAGQVMTAWRGLFRFPILIDDGSVGAAENIARFVRAFKPSRVVRWNPEAPPVWPGDQGERAKRMIEILGGTLQMETPAENMKQILERMRELRIGPQGVVAINPDDPSWIAGVALAAARVQVIVFIQPDRRVNGAMDGTAMRDLTESIHAQLRVLGAEWTEPGDEIDMVTLAANLPLRVGLGEEGKDDKALTDLVGRHRAGVGNRWAWAGALFGDPQDALYRAMCGLFLPTKSAWLFDGYGQGDPWDLYDATTAGRTLADAGYTVTVHDTPANRLDDWRRACDPGIETDLVLINSKGNMNFFEIGGEKAWCGDIPLLDRPVVVHMVHSWSSRVPGSARTVAGRWLEHGAYAFYGSVDEPFLNAFVQTPRLALRFLSGMPLGVACRQDGGPPWKLNVLGDPLITFAPDSTAGRRIGPDLPIRSVSPVDAAATEALKNEDFAAALRGLTLAGRDEDAARLADALIRQRPEAVTPEVARSAVMPLFRQGRVDAVPAAFAALSPDDAKTLLLRDALWHAGRRVLARGPDTRTEGLLARNLREGQEEHDAVEIATHIATRAGTREAVYFLEGVSPTLRNERQQKVVADAIRRLGGPTAP
jgi:hypothetical protein